MQIYLGKNEKTQKSIVLDTSKAINAHVQIAGISGMGKTTRLISMLKAMVESASQQRQALRIHVIDPHGDIDLPYASEVLFSEASQYGYNPLEVNPDKDYGGVRKSIRKFIEAVQKHKMLGTKQEAVLRYLLEDLYGQHGYKADDSNTWIPDDARAIRKVMAGKEDRVYLSVSFEHRERFKSMLKDANGKAKGGWDDFDKNPDMKSKCSWWIYKDAYEGDFLMWEPKNLFKVAPNLDDLVRFTEKKLKANFLGTNSAAISLLTDVNREARGYNKKVLDLSKRGTTMEAAEYETAMANLEKVKGKAADAYTGYLDAIINGREIDDLIRYNSTDVLTSVYERVQNLRAIGICNPVPPPFDPSMPIWRYVIKPLEIPVQRMFVDLVCARIFERAVQRGVQKDVVEIIVLDEGKRYASDEEQNILNVIANEARKFGVGLWIASQSPAHFSDDIIKSTGTIIVLGLAEADTSLAARKLGIESVMLNSIIPHQTAMIQIKEKGVLASTFQNVRLSK